MTNLPAVTSEPAVLSIIGLGRQILLLAWDCRVPTRGSRLKIFADDVPIRLPIAHASIPISGGWRSLEAIGMPEGRLSRVTVRDTTDQILAQAGGDFGSVPIDPFDPFVLSADTDTAGRARLLRFLLEVCPATFRLADDAMFAEHCRRLLAEFAAKPGQILPRCHLVGRWVFCEGVVQAGGFTGKPSAVLLSAGTIRRLTPPPGWLPDAAVRAGFNAIAMLVERAAAEAGGVVVLFAGQGFAIRHLGGLGRDLPSAVDWLRGDPQRLTPHRHFLFQTLLDHASKDDGIAAFLRELKLRLPPRPPRALAGDDALAVSIDIIIAGTFGTFVAGRLSDDHRLADVLALNAQDRSDQIAVADLARFMPRATGPVVATSIAEPTGFAGLFALADPSGLAPCGVSLNLRSGESLRLTEGPSPLSPMAARAALLDIAAAIGPDPRVLAGPIAPVVAALTSQLLHDRCAPAIVDIGQAANPSVASLIMPFDTDPARLRCRLALSAIDPTMTEVEMIFVIDAASAVPAVKRRLADLHAVFGVPVRLVVTDGVLSPAVIRNAGARAATAPVLVFGDEETLPAAGGWLPRLVDFLLAKSERGAVGGQRIFDDHAVVDAGYDIVVADDDITALRPRFAGFPRDFRPAAVPVLVDAVSAGCLAVRRSLFERLGGFDEAYLAADYADADFCLRVREAGLEVWRTAEATLLQAASAVSRTDGATAIADALDRIVFDRRWRSLIEARSSSAEATNASYRVEPERRARPVSPKAA